MGGILVFVGAVSLGIMSYIIFGGIFNIIFMPKLTTLQRLSDVERLDELKDDDFKDVNFTKQLAEGFLNAVLEVIETIVPRNTTALKNMERQLRRAGINMTPTRYSALSIFRILLFAFIFIALGIALGLPSGFRILSIFVGIYAGYTINRFSLIRKLDVRKDEIYHQLPEVIDLLSVSVAAGLGFDQAIAYVVEKSKGALIDEFDITRKEMSLGVSRKEALDALAERCNNREIQTFVTAVVQSEIMGANINNILQVQSETIREIHRQNIEEKAQKLPVTMLLPLVAFIFPNVLIIILAPAILNLMKTLS